MSRGRRRALALIAALCLVGAGAYLALAALSPSPVTSEARPYADAAPTELAGARLLVRAVDRDDPALNGRVFVVKGGRPRPLAGPELACARVYFAGGRGLCLATAESGVISYEATIFDDSLRALARLPLAGLPSRARVSRDGRYGAMTVFVNGHAYLSDGGFSTATTLVDMRSGESLGNLESFTVRKDGRRFDAADFNFWGVTFAADPDRFYATLRSGGHHYLVEGSIGERRMRVLRDGVECPSLSPDGTRIAFKSRIGDEDRWRLEVLDLATLRAHSVAEHHSFDDQAEWLDASTLVYSDRFDVYAVPADGSGARRLVVEDATSPAALGAVDAASVKPGLEPKAQGEG